MKISVSMTGEVVKALYRSVALCAVCVLLALGAQPATAQRRRESKVPEQKVRLLMRDQAIKDVLVFKSEYSTRGLAKRLTAELIDLNRDGKPEITVRGVDDICGAHNCYYWIYRRAANGYRLLLDAGFIQ